VKKLLMFDAHQINHRNQRSLCGNALPEIRGRGEISSRPQNATAFRRETTAENDSWSDRFELCQLQSALIAEATSRPS
jgi:hypothetical protein